ncbi:MAG TPA: hypothetical protein VGD40_09365 [Chryseosolibacter sp.]
MRPSSYFSFLVFLAICSCNNDKVDPGIKVSWQNLSADHKLGKILCYDYSATDKVYVLGYNKRYEVRDEKFNLLRNVELDYAIQSILYTSDSIYTSSSGGIFRTANGTILKTIYGEVRLVDEVNKTVRTLYVDPDIGVRRNDFVETDDSYFFVVSSKTAVIRIDKATFQVQKFNDELREMQTEHGWSLVKTQGGDVLLSLSRAGFITDQYAIFKDGTWSKFEPADLKSMGLIEFVDSRNYAWVSSPLHDYFRVYDLTEHKYVPTRPEMLSGNYSGYDLREHSNGDILVLSGTLESTSYELMQIHFE